MNNIKALSYEEILKILEDKDIKHIFPRTAKIPDEKDLVNQLDKDIGHNTLSSKTVLGIDIYQYSQYEPLKQTLVPFLFTLLYREVAKNCLKQAGYIFQDFSEEDFDEAFISTGDGGFQIFDTPIHAISFAIQFELLVRYYNSYHFYPKLRKIIGHLNLRYAMTYDKIFKFENNYFGPSIINNHRILSRDSLNRFLIDEETFNWFMLNMNGIENIQFASLEDISNLKAFESYDPKHISDHDVMYPPQTDFSYQKIIGVHVQKIGDISAKHTNLSIYNLHLQYLGGIYNEKSQKREMVTVSLGNLNIQGID